MHSWGPCRLEESRPADSAALPLGQVRLSVACPQALLACGCLETYAAHGGSAGWSSGGCESMFLTESSALARGRDCPETHAAHGVPRVGQAAAARACLSLNHPRSRGGGTACLETTYGSRAQFWPLGAHPPLPNRRLRSARGFALRPSRGSAAGASGPSWRSIWTLPWRRAPTHAGTSLVKDGLLEPRLLLGHAHQCMCEA